MKGAASDHPVVSHKVSETRLVLYPTEQPRESRMIHRYDGRTGMSLVIGHDVYLVSFIRRVDKRHGQLGRFRFSRCTPELFSVVHDVGSHTLQPVDYFG